MEDINDYKMEFDVNSDQKMEVNPFTQAAQFLHENAKIIEEGAGVDLIRQTNLDKTHTRLDFARALRTAANFLDGTQSTL